MKKCSLLTLNLTKKIFKLSFSILTASISPAVLSSYSWGEDLSNSSKIKSFILFDANTGEDLETITDGTVVNLASLSTRDINVKVNTDEDVSSVVFQLNSIKRFRHESAKPFTLAGKKSGKFNIWNAKPGAYTIKVNPSFYKTRSSADNIAKVSFSIVDNQEENLDSKNLNPQPTPKEIENKNIVIKDDKDIKEDIKASRITDELSEPLDIPTTSKSTLDEDESSLNIQKKELIRDNRPDNKNDESKVGRITAFYLIDATSGTRLQQLMQNGVVNVSDYKSKRLNILAETEGKMDEVIFNLNSFDQFNIQKVPPYSLAGSTNNKYNSWVPNIGLQTLTVTPVLYLKKTNNLNFGNLEKEDPSIDGVNTKEKFSDVETSNSETIPNTLSANIKNKIFGKKTVISFIIKNTPENISSHISSDNSVKANDRNGLSLNKKSTVIQKELGLDPTISNPVNNINSKNIIAKTNISKTNISKSNTVNSNIVTKNKQNITVSNTTVSNSHPPLYTSPGINPELVSFKERIKSREKQNSFDNSSDISVLNNAKKDEINSERRLLRHFAVIERNKKISNRKFGEQN